MALSVGSVVRVSAILKDARSSDVVNTFDIQLTDTGDDGVPGFKEDVNEWLTELYTTIQGILDQNATYDRIAFYERAGFTVLTPILWDTPPINAATGQELPAGIAALVYGRTDVRHVIGRKYLGPMTEDINVDGFVSSGGRAALQDFADFWALPFSGTNNWEWISVVWRGLGPGAAPVLETAFSPNWAIQRRRRIGRGS